MNDPSCTRGIPEKVEGVPGGRKLVADMFWLKAVQSLSCLPITVRLLARDFARTLASTLQHARTDLFAKTSFGLSMNSIMHEP